MNDAVCAMDQGNISSFSKSSYNRADEFSRVHTKLNMIINSN